MRTVHLGPDILEKRCIQDIEEINRLYADRVITHYLSYHVGGLGRCGEGLIKPGNGATWREMVEKIPIQVFKYGEAPLDISIFCPGESTPLRCNALNPGGFKLDLYPSDLVIEVWGEKPIRVVSISFEPDKA